MDQENRREHGRTGYQGPRAERQQHREEREVHTDVRAYSDDAGDRDPGPSRQADDTSSERGLNGGENLR